MFEFRYFWILIFYNTYITIFCITMHVISVSSTRLFDFSSIYSRPIFISLHLTHSVDFRTKFPSIILAWQPFYCAIVSTFSINALKMFPNIECTLLSFFSTQKSPFNMACELRRFFFRFNSEEQRKAASGVLSVVPPRLFQSYCFRL